MKFKLFKDFNENTSDYLTFTGLCVALLAIVVVITLFLIIRAFPLTIFPLAYAGWWVYNSEFNRS